MHITILAIGARQPGWIDAGAGEYLKRFPRGWKVELVDLPPGKRNKGADPARAVADEGERMLARVTERQVFVALDERGAPMTTAGLSKQMSEWAQTGNGIVFAIGGPDGHAKSLIDRADRVVSLSAMTLPHGLVRVMLIEQLYRCWSILNRHPYHRD